MEIDGGKEGDIRSCDSESGHNHKVVAETNEAIGLDRGWAQLFAERSRKTEQLWARSRKAPAAPVPDRPGQSHRFLTAMAGFAGPRRPTID